MTHDEHSVTVWLDQVKAGDQRAAQLIWQRYFAPLVRVASSHLRRSAKRTADEEDIAVSAFDALFRGAAQGRFPDLNDRQDLWQVLVMLTERKSVDYDRRVRAERRGGGNVRGDSVFQNIDHSLPIQGGFQQVIGREPTPEFTAMMSDELNRLMSKLEDEVAGQIALLKLAGHTNDEIGDALGISLRSVERKLNLIRRIWQEDRSNES